MANIFDLLSLVIATKIYIKNKSNNTMANDWLNQKHEKQWGSRQQRKQFFTHISKHTRTDKRHINCTKKIYTIPFTKDTVQGKTPKQCVAFLEEITNARISKQRTLWDVLTAYLESCKKSKRTVGKIESQWTPSEINRLIQWTRDRTRNDERRCWAGFYFINFKEATIEGRSSKECQSVIKEIINAQYKQRTLQEVVRAYRKKIKAEKAKERSQCSQEMTNWETDNSDSEIPDNDARPQCSQEMTNKQIHKVEIEVQSDNVEGKTSHIVQDDFMDI